MNYTDEEKKAFIAEVSKWKSELVRYRDFNVYYHPDKPTLPYRKAFNNGYVKMVKWNVKEDGTFNVMKDNETYTLNAFELQDTSTLADYLSPKPDKDGWTTISIPIELKPIIEEKMRKIGYYQEVESPF